MRYTSATIFSASLVEMKYERNDLELTRGKFRVRGNVIEICPAYEKNIVRLEIFDDVLEKTL